jgi:hypothetical protein
MTRTTATAITTTTQNIIDKEIFYIERGNIIQLKTCHRNIWSVENKSNLNKKTWKGLLRDETYKRQDPMGQLWEISSDDFETFHT